MTSELVKTEWEKALKADDSLVSRDDFEAGWYAALDWSKSGQEPVGFLFQHEETGLTEVVDAQQVEWGFEKNNPRWQKIGPVFTHPAPAQPAAEPCEPSEYAKRTLDNPPERIYLQVGDVESEYPGEISWRDVSWCDEQIDRSDLVYVRSDLAQPAVVQQPKLPDLVRLFVDCERFIESIWFKGSFDEPDKDEAERLLSKFVDLHTKFDIESALKAVKGE